MILNSEQIKSAVTNSQIKIDPFDLDRLKGASYTFSLGNKYRKLKKVDYIDSRKKEIDFDEFEMDEKGYIIQPREFIICQTSESLSLSNTISCFLTMRGLKAQMGIDALRCEIFCEPGSKGGWGGKLMLETCNYGPNPIKLFPGIEIVKAIFISIDK